MCDYSRWKYSIYEFFHKLKIEPQLRGSGKISFITTYSQWKSTIFFSDEIIWYSKSFGPIYLETFYDELRGSSNDDLQHTYIRSTHSYFYPMIVMIKKLYKEIRKIIYNITIVIEYKT